MDARRFARFDGAALHAALDAERQARRLTWQKAAQEIGPSASTVAGTAKRGIIEADGVFCILEWLGMPAESFLRGSGPARQIPPFAGRAKQEHSGRGTRVDTPALYTAMDAERNRRGLTWREVAAELAPDVYGATAITRLASGGRAEIHGMMAMVQWLGVPAETFVHRRGDADYGPVLQGRDYRGADRNPMRPVKAKTT